MLRILLVDDHVANRNSLRIAIDSQPDLKVIGEAGTLQEALNVIAAQTPDVLVLDLNLPDGNGWALIEQLNTANTLPPTLVLSVCDEHVFARRLLSAGARGYLMKDAPLAQIIQSIHDVHAGHTVASAPIASLLMQEALGRDEPLPPTKPGTGLAALSDRELQICAMLGSGLRNKEIARSLGLSEKTIATYKSRLMEKLGVQSTPELIERHRALTASL
jgi:DNA-binding NarL/FixJ family response regulator